MSDRVVLCIGTKKGLFVAEGAKTRRKFELRGPFGSGVAVYSALVDARGAPKNPGLELQRLFWDEGPSLNRSRQKV